MELKDFIKNTISSICDAIVESQNELDDSGVIINPEKLGIDNDGNKALLASGNRYVQNLDFDVLIAVEDKKGDNIGGGLKIASVVDFGGKITDESISKSHSRIKFSIPVAFSTSPTPTEYEKRSGIRSSKVL